MTPIDGWVLWGFHPAYCGGEPIKLAGGVRAEVRAASKWRTAEGFTCGIYRAGTPPHGLRAQAAEAKARG
jgi:hypothetical protein